MSAKPAIVTTLKHPSPSVLEFFVKYHQAIGFEHLFLFFDDPDDSALDQAKSYPGVTAIANDELLESVWEMSDQYALSEKLIHLIEARQVFNCEVAIELSLDMGFDWLLHIDIDELFYSPRCSASEHFDALDARGIDNVVYMNFEAVPESEDIDNYFTEVTLFKKNPYREGHLRFDERQERMLRGLTERYGTVPYHGYFLYYVLGKSAARVTPSLGARHPVLWGVHRFVHRSDPGRRRAAAGDDQLVLHYPCCGFGPLWRRYENSVRPKVMVSGTFYNDVARFKRRNDLEGARRLYRDMVMLSDRVETFLDADILCRIEEPARMWRQFRGLTGAERLEPSDVLAGRPPSRTARSQAGRSSRSS